MPLLGENHNRFIGILHFCKAATCAVFPGLQVAKTYHNRAKNLLMPIFCASAPRRFRVLENFGNKRGTGYHPDPRHRRPPNSHEERSHRNVTKA